MQSLIDLTGKNAVVTGGSRGVGRATALMLAQAGAAVGIGYRSRADEAAEAVAACRAYGVHAWAQAGDLSSADDVEALFSRADKEFDGLDIFVGNHGIWPPVDAALADMTDSQWHTTMGANLHSIFYTCRAAARRLRDQGRIVLVSSTAGQRGEAYHGDYASTKGAMISLVKGLCIELGARGITVNSVAPGWIDTEMSESAFVGEARDRVASAIPIRRIATSEDVAGPIVFLCSELGRHVTGEILNVNGGAVLVG
ncbi:MAG: SDR family oxidoreductase [Gemmatimonadetes bacterium]|nr:SDR family oxidoreductase [Gemmatimonadota bacterium]MDA1104219.1 SDR family oxidoreductase [Gemmatimonadota bacterium]